MKEKKYLYIAIVFLIFSFFVYLILVIRKNENVAKFIYAYWLLNKSNIASSNNNFSNPCLFSDMKLKNNVELQCKALNASCDNKIPSLTKDINVNNACAIITFDVNGFKNNPNLISSDKKINDQYQILVYNNGITAIPNSIEDKILTSREHSFNRRIQNILLFIVVGAS